MRCLRRRRRHSDRHHRCPQPGNRTTRKETETTNHAEELAYLRDRVEEQDRQISVLQDNLRDTREQLERAEMTLTEKRAEILRLEALQQLHYG